MDALPDGLRAALEPGSLLALVRSLAPKAPNGPAGVTVAEIIASLLAGCALRGPERARIYMALREALRQRIESMDGLVYVAGPH
jgi:hypothetical protein